MRIHRIHGLTQTHARVGLAHQLDGQQALIAQLGSDGFRWKLDLVGHARLPAEEWRHDNACNQLVS